MPYLKHSPSDSPYQFLPITPVGICRIILRLFLFMLWTPLCIILVFFARLISQQAAGIFFRLFHRGVCFIFGLRVKISGQPHSNGTTLFLFNHVSYLDIMAIGGHINGYFVAKSEVADWPVLGYLSKIQRTVFIDRSPRKAVLQVAQLGTLLKQGINLMIFPEGTSTDGTCVAKIKSSLIAAAINAGAGAVQPCALIYNDKNGTALSPMKRDTYTWYGDMPFFEHLLHMLAQNGVEITIEFGPAIIPDNQSDRKMIAKKTQIFIERTLDEQVLLPQSEKKT